MSVQHTPEGVGSEGRLWGELRAELAFGMVQLVLRGGRREPGEGGWQAGRAVWPHTTTM